jgi:hypothetical protein
MVYRVLGPGESSREGAVERTSLGKMRGQDDDAITVLY